MFTRTVDSVLASFNKTITSLEDIAVVEANKATSKRDQAAALLNEADSSDYESVRASNIATKLSGLLN